MTYAKNSKIEAADFNNIVGLSTTSTSGQLNAILGPGNGSYGYGQTTVPQVSANASITFNDWANVVNQTNNLGYHQATALTAVTVPVQGARIDYSSAIPTNITTLTSKRLNANAQGTTTSLATQSSTSWYAALTFGQTATFANANAARYFFNAGGQLALSFSSPSGSGINGLMSTMATNAGTLVMSALGSSGDITIAGTVYQGVTKVGGSSTGSPTVASTFGYYGLSTANTQIYTISASGTPSGYTSSNITVLAKTNGLQGSLGDNGTVISLYTVWDEIPNGLYVSSGTQTTLTVRYPSSTYLGNTWGAVSLNGGVTGT